MEEFRGDTAQIEVLRHRLRELYGQQYRGTLLERMAEQEAARLHRRDRMTRQDINKFRVGPENGGIKKPHDPFKLKPLWNVVFSGRYDVPSATPPEPVNANLQALTGPHGFFHASVKFFHVHQHRQKRVSVDLLGRFAFYHFSEYFHKFSDALPRAVLCGEWDIKLVDGAYCVTEKQSYDGKLGRRHATDRYNGYCLPKGPNICLVLRQRKKETPKIYILTSALDDLDSLETQVLSGFMLKGSEDHRYFHSPVYALRVPKDQPVACNILRCEAIDPHVLEELEVLAKR